MLREFEQVIPGSANRILEMAERQEQHRHNLENAHVHGNLRSQYVGQFSALLIGLAGLGSGTFLLHEGRSAEGLAAMFGPLAGLVVVFLVGRQRQEQERREKLRQLEQ